MESRKLVLMNLSAGQQWRRRHREQTCGHSGGRRGRRKWREQHGNIYMATYKIESQWDLLYDSGNSNWCSVTA